LIGAVLRTTPKEFETNETNLGLKTQS